MKISPPTTELLAEKTAKPYLKLQLGQNIPAVLSMENTQEVLTVASRKITPMPNLPECFIGLLNQRSRIFWVINFPQILGLPPVDINLQQYSLVIIYANKIPLGLVVPAIKGVVRLVTAEIQSPIGNVAPDLVPYLQGCLLQENQIVLVLDPEAIVNAPILSFHSS